ncbi:MAG: glutathione S-transferase C-terminal domain-containing protein, partial [Burkholderiaceae bacterium]
AMMDHSTNPVTRVFESGSILFYLAEKFGAFLPTEHARRTETMNWLFWQKGSTPYVGGGFGHFYAYADVKQQYPIDRFTMETKRQLDVLERQLADNQFVAGDEYTIADMAIWPWYGGLVIHNQYEAQEFIDAASYTNVIRWARELDARAAVKRGRMVNRLRGEPHEQLRERHDAGDFDTKTQDKIEVGGAE